MTAQIEEESVIGWMCLIISANAEHSAQCTA